MLVYQRVHQLETRCRGKKANSLRFARSMSSTASSWPLCCVPGSSRPGSCRMQPCCCLGGPCCLAKRLVVNAWPMWMNFSGKDWLGLPLASCDSKSLSYWWSVWCSEGFPLWRQLVIEVGTAVWCTVSAAACWHYDHLEQCQMPGRDADAAVIWQPHICKVNAEWSPMTWFFFPANLFPNRGFFSGLARQWLWLCIITMWARNMKALRVWLFFLQGACTTHKVRLHASVVAYQAWLAMHHGQNHKVCSSLWCTCSTISGVFAGLSSTSGGLVALGAFCALRHPRWAIWPGDWGDTWCSRKGEEPKGLGLRV